MSKVLVTGGKGNLGKEIQKFIDADFIDIEDVDITDEKKIRERILDGNYDIVFHLAASTNLERCEKDHDFAFNVNVTSTEHIAEACKKIGCYLVYPSTDYVFNGNKGMYLSLIHI